MHVEVGHIISATVNTEQVRELADPESEGLRHPEILDGKPCIRGTRLSVEFLLELAASGATQEQILAQYPQLTS